MIECGQKFWTKSYNEIVPFTVSELISETEFYGVIEHQNYSISRVKKNISDINKTLFENKEEV